MSRRPTHATTAGRTYLELRRIAREQARPTDELLQLFALEAVLSRLAVSPHADRFVLKGGVLLAAFDARRPTRDIDLAGSGIRNDPDSIRSALAEIIGVEIDDGVEFDPAGMKAEVIRESDDYSGVRVSIPCRLASAKLNFHVDVNVGDPIVPAPISVSIPRILGGEPLVVRGYSVAMVLAEKVVTMIQRGSANTRWRDFVDTATLTGQNSLNFSDVRNAVEAVSAHRNVDLQPLDLVLSGFAEHAQARWTSWRRRQGVESRTPEAFRFVLEQIFGFTEPLTSPRSDVTTWDPRARRWQ